MKQGRISTRIIGITLLMFIVLFTVTVVMMINSSRQSVEGTIGQQAISVAQNISTYIDSDQYKELIENPSETPLYWELREQLNELREHNGVLYTYTFGVPKEGEAGTFLVDGMPKDDTENAAAIGDVSSGTTYEHLMEAKENGGNHTDIIKSEYGQFVSGTVPLKDENGEIYGYLGVDIDASYVQQLSKTVSSSVLPTVILLFIVITIVAIGIIYVFTKRTLAPLQLLQLSSEHLAKGDLMSASKELDAIKTKSNNEITAFVTSFKQSLNSLKGTFEVILQRTQVLEQVVSQIDTTSTEVSQANDKIVQSVTSIVHSSEQQNDANAEITTAISEMTLGITRLADTTSDIADASTEMTTLVSSGVTSTERVVGQIQDVEQSVLRTSNLVSEMGQNFASVENMVTIITNIADQTNLLALNAAIEAARAGEAGKGFAVVADEVRKLAELSRQSAEDIQNHLQTFKGLTEVALTEMNSSTAKVKHGTEAVTSIVTTLEQIQYSVQEVNDKIQDDTAVIQQMSAGSEEILASTEDVKSLVSANAEETYVVAKAADLQVEMMQQLKTVVQQLDETSKNVINEIHKFKI
ncbi:MAG: methyl-accepting chemotaxis protein [Lysinibacillus sp.]